MFDAEKDCIAVFNNSAASFVPPSGVLSKCLLFVYVSKLKKGKKHNMNSFLFPVKISYIIKMAGHPSLRQGRLHHN